MNRFYNSQRLLRPFSHQGHHPCEGSDPGLALLAFCCLWDLFEVVWTGKMCGWEDFLIIHKIRSQKEKSIHFCSLTCHDKILFASSISLLIFFFFRKKILSEIPRYTSSSHHYWNVQADGLGRQQHNQSYTPIFLHWWIWFSNLQPWDIVIWQISLGQYSHDMPY